MKDGIKQIIGKTVTGVLVVRNERPPARQVFLLFSDDTCFEFWGNDFTGAGGVDPGDARSVQESIERAGGEVRASYS